MTLQAALATELPFRHKLWGSFIHRGPVEDQEYVDWDVTTSELLGSDWEVQLPPREIWIQESILEKGLIPGNGIRFAPAEGYIKMVEVIE